MYILNESDYKLIDLYKKSKDEDIALYFFNKFKDELINLTFYKINKKFSSIPFEKGDLFHLVWNSIKKTLKEYKKKQNFSAMLVRNCYLMTIDEVKKFVNNNQLIMNISGSFDKMNDKSKWIDSKSCVSNFELPREMMLKDLIENVSVYLSNYSQSVVKRSIYLKSSGYSISYICKKLKLPRSYVDNLFKSIERIVKKMYF